MHAALQNLDGNAPHLEEVVSILITELDYPHPCCDHVRTPFLQVHDWGAALGVPDMFPHWAGA